MKALPRVKPMVPPPDPRIIALDRPPIPTHQQIEEIRFGLGDTGPLAQAALNSNVKGLLQTLPFGVTCSSGMVMAFSRQATWAAPDGWLECNGASVAKADYPDLYAIIGDTYGATTSNFTLPTIAQISATIRYVVKT